MCGIIGYVGKRQVVPVLLQGLYKLEYRGYDSAGIAIIDKNSKDLKVEKQVGKIKDLHEKLWDKKLEGNIGIGHSRWATHGSPTLENAHPHVSKSEIFAVVHNGIIENYLELKNWLKQRGYDFKSQTDTEVIAHLFEELYNGDFLGTAINVAKKLEGAFAIGVISKFHPDTLIAIKKGSPLVIGISKEENFIASDMPAVLEYTKDFIIMNDKEIAVIKKEVVSVFDLDKNRLEKEIVKVNWSVSSAQKAGFKHFMQKEIFEQPRAITDTIAGFNSLDKTKLFEMLEDVDRLYIIACGTSLHAGLVGKFWIEKFAKIPVEVDFASEYRYRDKIISDKTVIIGISQSGETADTRFALLDAKNLGARTVSIVNVVGSSLSRESDFTLYTYSGPEIGVAATKTFISQLVILFLLALELGKLRGNLSNEEYSKFLGALSKIPSSVEKILLLDKSIKDLAYKYMNAQDFLFLGRNINYPVALEGALKLKEISYIHAEGYPAGEMKHGPIALIDENMPVVAIAVKDRFYEKMLSNIQEVKARKGKVIAVATEEDKQISQFVDDVIYIPETLDELYPFLSIVPLQLLSYHIATLLGKDVDQPRNLAKTVTVE